MANPQRSRYPRPLKATQNFTSPTGQAAGRPLVSTAAGGRGACGEMRASTEQPSDEAGEANPRRSSSLSSLEISDTDTYMDSLWPRLPPANQFELDSEEPMSDISPVFLHKRSNSLSSADRLSPTASQVTSQSRTHHTRTSIEGLNQEISCALEGKPIEAHLHPDGHIAPVRDLLGRASFGARTPPPLHSPTSPSPHLTASPSQYSGQATLEPPSLPLHPSSPKPSFAREPPDGAERCITEVKSAGDEGFVPVGPDKSKANIVFRGSVFAPLLAPSHLHPLTPPLSVTTPINSH